MPRISPSRLITAACVALCASLPAQPPQTQQPEISHPAPPQSLSTLPLTAPTTLEPPPIPLTPSQLPPKRAQVTYASGSLSISADNSSLNQILRQIASETGIKITGGVTDERVFGEYGPAEPAQILAALLDGTDSNMVIVHRDGNAPAELILTPRQGGPTPPNPNASTFDDRSDRSLSQETPAPQPEQTIRPAPATGGQPFAPASQGTSTAAPSVNSSQPESPNGVKTPQQIYEQLQRMRQQQQQQAQPQSRPQPQQ